MNALSNATRNELLDEIERLTRERDAAEARIRRWQNEHDVIEERDRLSNQNTKLVAEMAVLQRAHGEALAYGARRTTQLNDTVRENERLTRERDEARREREFMRKEAHEGDKTIKTFNRCPEEYRGMQCILEAGHCGPHEDDIL